MDHEGPTNTPSESIAPTAGKPARGLWKLILLLLIVAGVIVAIKYFRVADMPKQTLDWIKGLGPWGPIIFIGLYVLACVCLVPASVLTLGGGAIFGVVYGSIYVFIGATLGATAAFLVGRYFARGWVAKRIEGSATFNAIDKAVAREGWKIVGLTRLSPVFPFVLLNYAFGITQVSLRDYVLASAVGMLPGTIMYVYIGSLAQVAGQRQRTPAEWSLYGVGLLATVVVTIFITRIAKKALAQRISQ
jgi:uncharacterized membrane protein YdjX (TVP38/TMEM64 family)